MLVHLSTGDAEDFHEQTEGGIDPYGWHSEDDEEDDEFEIPMELIDQVDSNPSFTFRKDKINAVDMDALQEIVSGMKVHALQAREGVDEGPEEPLESPVVKEGQEGVQEEKPMQSTEEPPLVEQEDQEMSQGVNDADIDPHAAEDQQQEEEEEEDDDELYDPREELRQVSQNGKYTFVQDGMDDNDRNVLQELMTQMTASAMGEVEEEDGGVTGEQHELQVPPSENEKADLVNEEATEGLTEVNEEAVSDAPETKEGDEENTEEPDPSEEGDDWFVSMDAINGVDIDGKFAFRKGAITPEDLDTLQELVSQMETGAMKAEDQVVREPHPLSYLPEAEGEQHPVTTGGIATVSAQGMHSNKVSDRPQDSSTTSSQDVQEPKTTESPFKQPLITTSKIGTEEIITTSPPSNEEPITPESTPDTQGAQKVKGKVPYAGNCASMVFVLGTFVYLEVTWTLELSMPKL